MGGKGRKRRDKNYKEAHGVNKNRLPPPPNLSSINALPSKLRKIMSFTYSSLQGSELGPVNNQLKNKKEDVGENKSRSEAKLETKSSVMRDKEDKNLTMLQVVEDSLENVNNDANEKKTKKRKRKQVNDLRFEDEIKKLGGISKRQQRKKEFLKAKKKKHQKVNSEQMLDLPKHDIVKFGDVVQAPPKLSVIPKAPKKPLGASHERLRLQAIEAYRGRKGWTNRPGIHLPPVSSSADL